MGRLAKQRTCIFCGKPTSRKRAVEHIIPKWVIKEFGWEATMVTGHHQSCGSIVSSRSSAIGGFVLGAVCAVCNNGWLSQVETQNQAVITGLARERLTFDQLQRSAKENLAKWAFKTVLVLNAASNYRDIVPPGHYRHLVERGSGLPSEVCVVAGMFSGGKGFEWLQNPFIAAQPSDGMPTFEVIAWLANRIYRIGLRINALAFLVVHSPVPGSRFRLDRSEHVLLYPHDDTIEWKAEQGKTTDLEEHEFPFDRWCSTVDVLLPPMGKASQF